MASAYAKFSGRLGVCIATSGPGASHLTTGLYDALMDHQPVLAIVGQQARNALGGQYQQELDLVSMFKDVASAYVVQASTPAQIRHLVDRAARIALSKRTVTAIILPNDLQDEAYADPPRAHAHFDPVSAMRRRGFCRRTLISIAPPKSLTAAKKLRC